MKRLSAPRLGGPVGLFFALGGYLVSVLVARSFVALEAHCAQSCPAVSVGDFRLHHFYYGLTFVLLSLTGLAAFEGLRTRWDAALVAGIGTGLVSDEVGLLVLGTSYWAPESLMVVGLGALALFSSAAYQTITQGTFDFQLLDRSDVLTILSVLLAMVGFLYFDRPARATVQYLSILAWVSALFLIGVYGRRHYMNIRHGQLEPSR